MMILHIPKHFNFVYNTRGYSVIPIELKFRGPDSHDTK